MITKQDQYVLTFIRKTPDLANNDEALIAEIWQSEGFNRFSSLYTALRSVTSADSIKRSRRRLHEHGFIDYDKNVSKKRRQLFEKARDENSTANIYAIKHSFDRQFSESQQMLKDLSIQTDMSSCCSASVYDPSDEGVEGRCNDCKEMCGIIHEQTSLLGDN